MDLVFFCFVSFILNMAKFESKKIETIKHAITKKTQAYTQKE